ncbi:MAG: hypothetical protein ABII12_11680 [Planctomycetota bacterium]
MSRYGLACALLFGALAQPGLAQEDEKSSKVIIEGREYEIYPADKLRARGFDVPEIPHDQNAAWVYVEAMNAMVDLPTDLGTAYESALDGQWPEGEDGERLAQWLGSNKQSLDLVRHASNMEQHYMPICGGESDALITTMLPTLSPSRQLAKMLSVESTYHLSQGNGEAAIDAMLTCRRFGNQVGKGKMIIEGLVGMAMSGVADRGLVRAAESGVCESEALIAAVAEMEVMADALPTFEEMMRGEQQCAESFIDDALDIPGVMGALRGGGWTGSRSGASGWGRLAARLKRLYLPDRAMKKHVRDHFDTIIKATRHEDGTVGMVLDEADLFKQIPGWDVMARIYLPSLARAHELTLMTESNFARTRMKLAVAAYSAEHGEPPPSLEALVPGYVQSVPADPMTGYDFEYAVLPGEKAAVAGLDRVSRENEEELRKKRRTPAILSPRASKWRRVTQSFCERYKLDDTQRTSAEAILRDLEARAARFEQVHGAKLQQLVDEGQADELRQHMGPLDEMFVELRKRLDALPTAKQRRAATGTEK